MKSWNFKLGIVGVFALGVIVGVVGTGLVIRYKFEDIGFNPGRPEQAIHHIMGKLSRELKLSDEQKRQIEPIVVDSFTKMRMLRSRLTPEVEALMAQSAAQIRPLLTPGQQSRFDAYNAEVLQKWKLFASPMGPMHSGPGGATEPPAK